MSPEECHTGAAAREILKHGFQFPLEQYTPEYYENTIVFNILLTTAVAKVIGVSPFTLKLIPFLFAYGCFVIACLLLYKSGFESGLWLYVLLYFFGTGEFIIQTMDAVGNHIIGLFFSMIIISVFYFWYTTKKPYYFYLFAFFVGFGTYVHMATALFSALCILMYFVCAPPFLSSFDWPPLSLRRMLTGFICFAVGMIPFMVFYIRTNKWSVLSIIANASAQQPGRHGNAFLPNISLRSLLLQYDFNIPALIFLSCSFVLIFHYLFKIRKRNAHVESDFLLYFLCFALPVVFVAVTLFSGGAPSRYYAYFYQIAFMTSAVGVSILINAFPSRTKGLYIQLILFIAFSLSLVFSNRYVLEHHDKQYNFSIRSARMKLFEDRKAAYCYWRFGRAFSHYTPKHTPMGFAVGFKRNCDRFDTRQKRFECYYGIGESGYSSYLLKADAQDIFGYDGMTMIANGIGSDIFHANGNINKCYSTGLSGAYVNDCILGYVLKSLADNTH